MGYTLHVHIVQDLCHAITDPKTFVIVKRLGLHHTKTSLMNLTKNYYL